MCSFFGGNCATPFVLGHRRRFKSTRKCCSSKRIIFGTFAFNTTFQTFALLSPISGLVSRYYVPCARGQPRSRRRSGAGWVTESERRIMAERRRQKKRIQVNAAAWHKRAPFRVLGQPEKPASESATRFCWVNTLAGEAFTGFRWS